MTQTEPAAIVRGELMELVLDFCRTLQRLCAEGSQYQELPPGFWDPLTEFLDLENYQRVSQDYEQIVDVEEARRDANYDSTAYMSDILNWEQWSRVAGDWFRSPSLWEYTVMRIAEFSSRGLPGIVYMELEERGGFAGQQQGIHWSNTIDMFEFNEEKKIRRIRLGVADYALRAWPVSSRSSKLPPVS
jgi:hypothetical protein